jgi:site-specific DNA recombinase
LGHPSSSQQQRRERTVRKKTQPTIVEASPLTGRLFDEHGDGLTPSHARKGERRYRYYVSRNLITGPANPAQRGWRLPAQQIENSVAVALREMLDDESSILQTVQGPDSDSPRVEVVLQAARSWSRLIQSEAETPAALATLVDRVDLQSDGMRISIRLPLATPETSAAGPPAEVNLTRFFPMLMKRRGVELRLVVGNRNGPAPSVDLTLLKAVARAHR